MNIPAGNATSYLYKFCSLTFAMLLSVETCLAADLTILVKEKGSGDPIEGATVVIDDGIAYSDTTKTGQATFSDLTQPKHIKVLATGYETLQQFVDNNITITVYLEPIVIEGEGLEVTADRLVEKTSKFSLATTELIKAAGSGGDPLKAISALPGIVPTEEGSAEVYMRGSNGNENITWINRAPVGYLYHFGGFQSTVNPKLIEDINVFLGGFPVEYGDALGGVVDARLRAPKNDRMHYAFDISTITSSFLVEGPVADAGGDSFFVAGRRSYFDLILSPADATEAFNEEDEQDPDQVILVPRFYDFQTLYHHKLNNGYFDTYLFAAGDQLAAELRGSAKSDPQLAGELRETIEYQTVGNTWQQRWNQHWDSVTNLSFLHAETSERLGRDALGQPFYANVEENTLYLQPELHWQPRKGSQLSFGITGTYVDIPVDAYISRGPSENDPAFDFTSKNKYRIKEDLSAAEFSPYIKYRHTLTDRLVGQLGLRQTNIKVKGGFHAHQLSPRATLEYRPSPDTLLNATWGRFIQMPDGEQVVESFGNPSLQVTEAEHRILGIEHNINSIYSVKAEIYHKPMQNLVVAIDENLPPDNFANRGTGEAYGFDLFIKRKPGQGKIGWLALSWARSRRTNEITGITRDFSGDQPLTLTVVWGQPFERWKRWDWSVKAQVHTGQPYTRITGRHLEDPTDPNSRWIAEYGAHNAERFPTYIKLDLRIGREVLYNERKMKYYFDIQNVSFHNNIVEYDAGDQYENYANPTEISGMGFFPFFGVEWEF